MNVVVEFDEVTNMFVNVLPDGRRLALSSHSYQAALREALWDMDEIDLVEQDES